MQKLKILLLAGNTLRSRCYAQQLKRLDNVEVSGIFYGFGTRECQLPELNKPTETYLKREQILIPDFNKSMEDIFDTMHWNYVYVDSEDINSESVLSAIAAFHADIVVFSGYGGQILGQDHFSSSVKYLHMHPGLLPLERGSTTLYYSILNKRKCTVTAFYMTADIDAGEHIYVKEYSVPDQGVNIDQYFDNCIRADCFTQAIKNIHKPYNQIIGLRSEEYYIIHPVLKHIAILSLK